MVCKVFYHLVIHETAKAQALHTSKLRKPTVDLEGLILMTRDVFSLNHRVMT
jgi:hypothetical protein